MITKGAGIRMFIVVIALAASGCGTASNSSDGGGGDGRNGFPERNSNRKIMVSSFDAIASTISIGRGNIDQHLVDSRPTFGITRYSDSSITVFMSVAGGGFDIRSMTVRILSKDGHELVSGTTTQIDASGTMNSETRQASVTTSAFVHLAGPLPDLDERVVMRAEMVTGNGNAWWKLGRGVDNVRGIVDKEGILRLFLNADPVDSGIRFALRIERLRPAPDGEYRPSAEACRFEILDSSGSAVWSSANGVMYAQVIGSVQPSDVGSSASCETIWDGTDQRNRAPVGAGTYVVRATIPARPTPYSVQIEFSYRGR